jgi:magnesium transporter
MAGSDQSGRLWTLIHASLLPWHGFSLFDLLQGGGFMQENILLLMKEDPLDVVKLHNLLVRMNTVDIAEVFEQLSKEQTIHIFRLLPKDMAADVFSYIIPEKQQIIGEALTDGEAGRIMEDLFVDDAVDFIEEMPANVVNMVLRNVTGEKRALINQFLRYPDSSVGSVMIAEYMALREDTSVREAFDLIRQTTRVPQIHTCYVVKRDRLLVGAVSLKKLLLAKQHERIVNLMDENVIYAQTLDDQEKAADLFRKYGLLSLPVVDMEKRLVGIITVDDVVRIMEEEATEDFEKMAALMPSDRPYLKTGVFKLAQKRIGWLLILMFSATITGTIISSYEASLAILPALIAFIPMLMDTSGNAGCQTSTLIIRSIALGEIEFKDVFYIWWREFRVALLCGFGLGIVNTARVLLTNDGDILLAFTVSMSLFAVILLAKTIGCLLPLIAKKIKLDPAVLASPLLTTILDGTSLLIYFSIAHMVLKI